MMMFWGFRCKAHQVPSVQSSGGFVSLFILLLFIMRSTYLLCALLAICLSVSLASFVMPPPPPANKLSAKPSHRFQDALNTIEYDATPSTLSLYIHTDGARGASKAKLFTFDSSSTVQDVLQSELLSDLLKLHSSKKSKHSCSIMDENSQKVESSQTMAEALAAHEPVSQLLGAKNSLFLHCVVSRSSGPASGSIDYSFAKFVQPTFMPNEIRARNKLYRALNREDSEYPEESAELIGDNFAGILGWVEAFLLHHWGSLHAYLDYSDSPQTGRWHLNTGEILTPESRFGSESDSEVKLAIAADWGAGTMESDFVQQAMMTSAGNAQWTLHIGDIYYVGSSDVVESHCLGQVPKGAKKAVTWPHGSLGSFAVMGNHELYGRAYGFFDTFLPTLGVPGAKGRNAGRTKHRGARNGISGQDAGFVALENKYWRVILLDTGFNTYSIIPGMDNKNNTQPAQVIDWLLNVVNISDPNDTRGIIFLSHHQVESAFGSPSQATPNQIADIMPPNRTVVWLWGHEHRLSFYKLLSVGDQNTVNVYGRCVGNSGFPASIGPIPQRAREAGLEVYDDRVYEMETGFFNMQVGYQGWMIATLNKNALTINYQSLETDASGNLNPTTWADLVQESYETDTAGNVVLTDFQIQNSNLTVISHV
jgi:hypothetical protein